MKTRLSGPVKLDWRLVANIAKDIAGKFESCGRVGNVKPVASKHVVFGRKTLRVSNQTDNFSDPISGFTQAMKGSDEVFVTLLTKKDLCLPKIAWQEAVFKFLAHEMTHAVDPGLLKVKRDDSDYDPREQYCRYANKPTEIAAFINTVKADLVTKIGREHKLISVPDNVTKNERLLYQSKTWRYLGGCYTPKIRKRFLKMVATNFEKTGDGWRVKD